MNKSSPNYEAGLKKMRKALQRVKRQRETADILPVNRIDKAVERLLKVFNRVTNEMNDATRAVIARQLAAKLSSIDAFQNESLNWWSAK